MAERVDLGSVRAVMVFAANPAESAAWWGRIADAPVHTEGGFHWLDIAGVDLGFHPEDLTKNPHGASTVAYWTTADLDAAIAAIVSAGGRLHRGPLAVEHGRRIAQVMDPFGAVMGLEQSA